MTDKKEEREPGYPRQNPPAPPEGLKTISFEKSDALVGQTLDGRFFIEKDLTEGGADAGGIGLVYLAKDLKLMGRETVVKILQKSALENSDLIRKFQHEKEALIRLDHPNIVRILDSGTLSDGNLFMVMEFIEGYSLRRKLRDRGRLNFDEAAHITESVTNALSVAHSKKVLHRDIKPENIMLTPQEDSAERVRLIDFGIARVEEAKLAPVTTIPRGIGTILYIAPEQLDGKLKQTPAIDIYSFAIVIYEMLTGELPFKPENVIEMFQLQQAGVKIKPRNLRAELSEEAEMILLSALEYDAQKRPPNARVFGRELANALRRNSSANVTERRLNLPKTVPLNVKSSPNDSVNPTEPFVPETLTEDITVSSIKTSSETSSPNNSNRAIWGIALGGLIFAAVLGVLGFAYWKSGKPDVKISADSSNTASVSGTNAQGRELIYFLNVQKMRDGKPFEEPFQSSGQEIFENGYKFKMNFQADAAGFIYVFNEDKNAQGKAVYNILFPTPKINNGAAEVKAKQQIATNQNTFSGVAGTEIVWLIWTVERQSDLEAARRSAFDGQGALKDEEDVERLKNFLDKYKDRKNETSKDTANRQTVVKSKGDVVAHRIELEHR